MLYLSVVVIKSGEIYRSKRPSSKGQYPSQRLILILPENFICDRLHVRMNSLNMVYETSTGCDAHVVGLNEKSQSYRRHGNAKV